MNTAYTKQLVKMKEKHARLTQKIDENDNEASNHADLLKDDIRQLKAKLTTVQNGTNPTAAKGSPPVVGSLL